MRIRMNMTSDEKSTSEQRLPLRELLRLSEMLVDLQIMLKHAGDAGNGVDIRVLSEPKHLDMEHRTFSIVDLTGGRHDVLHGPVPCARLDDLAGVARNGHKRWIRAHALRRTMRVVETD